MSLYLLVGEMRFNLDGVEIVNNIEFELNVVLLEGGEMERRDLDLFLNIFLEK